MPRVNVKDKRKQQLMEANIASIARRGFADTTIAHVSKGAGMSRGIVNFYFTSKEKMMQETLAFMADEFTAEWQEALAESAKQHHAPLASASVLLHALLADKLCTPRRMAVWTAFLGHAGTHAGYAKIIRAMDEALVKQLKDLHVGAGLPAKQAEQRARQMHALIRGHWQCAALGSDTNRPSSYSDAWLEWLSGKPAAEEPKKTAAKPQLVAATAKPKKPDAPPVLPGQLDFGDLFAKT